LENSIFPSTKKLVSFSIFVLLITVFFVSEISAQIGYSLSEDDFFEIPENNFSFRFSSNGTFVSAGLIDGFWVFEELELFNSRNDNKLYLKVSGQDCSIVIESYYVYNRTLKGENMKSAVLRYTTSVCGTQTFYLDLDPQMGSFDARLNREWVGLNHGWTVSQNGTYTIFEPTQNVSLYYYGYPESFGNKHDFLENHYVLVISLILLSIIIIFGIISRKKFDLHTSNQRDLI
jgi:hypothetical protein